MVVALPFFLNTAPLLSLRIVQLRLLSSAIRVTVASSQRLAQRAQRVRGRHVERQVGPEHEVLGAHLFHQVAQRVHVVRDRVEQDLAQVGPRFPRAVRQLRPHRARVAQAARLPREVATGVQPARPSAPDAVERPRRRSAARSRSSSPAGTRSRSRGSSPPARGCVRRVRGVQHHRQRRAARPPPRTVPAPARRAASPRRRRADLHPRGALGGGVLEHLHRALRRLQRHARHPPSAGPARAAIASRPVVDRHAPSPLRPRRRRGSRRASATPTRPRPSSPFFSSSASFASGVDERRRERERHVHAAPPTRPRRSRRRSRSPLSSSIARCGIAWLWTSILTDMILPPAMSSVMPVR